MEQEQRDDESTSEGDGSRMGERRMAVEVEDGWAMD